MLNSNVPTSLFLDELSFSGERSAPAHSPGAQLRTAGGRAGKSNHLSTVCGGENIEEARSVIDKLGRATLKPILDYGVEGKERSGF